MSLYVSPVLLATGTKPLQVRVRPILLAVGTKPRRIAARPVLLATVAEAGLPLETSLSADTRREVRRETSLHFDTLRQVQGESQSVSLFFGTGRVVERDEALSLATRREIQATVTSLFDSERVVSGRLRYANRGILDALFSYEGTVVTDEMKTDTGTGVTGKEGAYLTPLETALGFPALDEVWARWDAWIPAGSEEAAVTWYFFTFIGNTPRPSGITYGSALFNGNYAGSIPQLDEGIHTFVMHVSTGGIELFIDKALAVSYVGDLPQGTAWTHIAMQTGAQVMSNIIVANFDVSEESLAAMRLRISASFGTCREVCRVIGRMYAASRLIAHIAGNGVASGVQSVTMTLAENTLSDEFQMVTAQPVQPKDAVEGILLDFPYRFQAEETHEEGILFTVKRTMYDADKMLYTPLIYSLGEAVSHPYTDLSGKTVAAVRASVHAGKVAAAMGLEPVFMADDFVPRDSYAGTETTYQSVLSGLFGWTKNVPRMQVNVFIRGGRLHFLQRGHETGVIDLASVPWFNHPVFDRKVMRTTWSQEAEALEIGEADAPDVMALIRLRNVYSIEEDDKTPEPDDDGVSTVYEEVPRGGGSTRTDNRIKYTERVNPDGTTTRADYEYIDTGNDYLLRQITEVTTFPSGEVYKTRITRYTYTSDGWRHMVVTENDEVVEESEEATGGTSASSAGTSASTSTGSTAWRGRPGDRGNEHLDEQVALSHGGRWKKSGTSKGDSFLSSIPADAPVLDYDTCKAYRDELEWMDRRIEERASLTITAPVRQGVVDPAGNHVMDFFDRYLLNGNEYFLVSNTVSLTPRSLRQSLTLVRWY